MIPELEAIKRLFFHEWDPIGVSSNLNVANEYDLYAMNVFTSLQQGATADSIAVYLDWLVTEQMGLSLDDTAHNRAIAAKVMEIHAGAAG